MARRIKIFDPPTWDWLEDFSAIIKIVSFYDGDTVYGVIDWGGGHKDVDFGLRMYGLGCEEITRRSKYPEPERSERHAKGLESAAFFKRMVRAADTFPYFPVKSHKPSGRGKYAGRILGEMFLPETGAIAANTNGVKLEATMKELLSFPGFRNATAMMIEAKQGRLLTYP